MHKIRLRAPWTAQWTSLEPGERCANYSRSFHRPTGLVAGQSVTLVVLPQSAVDDHPLSNWLTVQLNQSPICGSPPVGTAWSADISELLEPFNQLVFTIDGKAQPAVVPADPSAPPPDFGDLFEVHLALED